MKNEMEKEGWRSVKDRNGQEEEERENRGRDSITKRKKSEILEY